MDGKPARVYNSPLREAQAEQTRERILDATLRVLGNGSAAFTMPAVAKEAKVSLPTVYRLFPNKEQLAEAARDAVRARFGIRPTEPSTIEGLLERQRAHIMRATKADSRLLRAMYVLNAEQLDDASIEQRRAVLASTVRSALKGIRGKDRIYFAQLLSMLFSSSTALMLWRFRLLNEDGADLFDWLVRTLLAGIRAKDA